MRGTIVARTTETGIQCEVCGLTPPIDLHTAQGSFWSVPVAHNAPCGQPCIGGGIEAPFKGHCGTGKCNDPSCVVKAPEKPKKGIAGDLPLWIYRMIRPKLCTP